MKVLGWLFSFGLLASTGKIITFDSEQIGRTPPGWTVAMTDRGVAPRWEVRKDSTAPTQPYVLAQVSNDSGHGRSALAILDSVSLRDGDVSVKVKPVAGREDCAGGVVWRYRDENNYYVVRADALDKTIAIFKVQNGRRIPVASEVKHNIPANAWSLLKISARGNRFQIFLDHRRVMQAWDNTFAGPGRVGLWTGADSVTYFDDFRVYPR